MDFPETTPPWWRRFTISTPQLLSILAAVVVLVAVGVASYLFLLPTRSFPTGQLLEIPEDASVGEMGQQLEDTGVIRSAFLFRAYARVTGQDRALASGPYVFEKPLGLVRVVHRMANGEHGIVQSRITFTEGMTVDEMAVLLDQQLPGFDTETFLELSSTSEGYLFPDTYFFMPGTTPEEVVERLRNRFDEQLQTIEAEIAGQDMPIEDLVVMASLLEREAQTEADMRVIAGILWARLDEGMLLQVDAVFAYIKGERGYVPTGDDLDHPSKYNTYRYKGLPPGPIANPGLSALRAAATPEMTEYRYYLTGRDGVMYYGRTFDEHKRNRELYLD